MMKNEDKYILGKTADGVMANSLWLTSIISENI